MFRYPYRLEVRGDRVGIEELQKYPYAFGYGWRSFIDYSLKTGTLVAATQFGEVLEIWNFNKNSHKVLKGKLGEPEFEIRPEYAIPAGAVGHNDIQVTDRAVYVIYRGMTIKDEMLARRKGKPLPTGGKETLYCRTDFLFSPCCSLLKKRNKKQIVQR